MTRRDLLGWGGHVRPGGRVLRRTGAVADPRDLRPGARGLAERFTSIGGTVVTMAEATDRVRAQTIEVIQRVDASRDAAGELGAVGAELASAANSAIVEAAAARDEDAA